MHALTPEHAQSILDSIAPGHQLVSVAETRGSFTNESRILNCRTPSGDPLRLVVKFLIEDDPSASERAIVEFHGLRIARAGGIPAPEPVYLDEAGALLGIPGVVTRYVDGRQVAAPSDPVKWAKALALQLIRIHDITPAAEDRQHLFDGNDMALYFLRGDNPRRMGTHPLSSDIFEAVQELQTSIASVPPVLLHMDYWPGNVLWIEDRISAVLDWDAASYGDPALDVAYFRMNMYLRGIKSAADIFLKHYEKQSGAAVQNLGYWELACAARPLPDPVLWIPMSREMGDMSATDDRADTDYYEFVADAMRRAHAGR